VRAQRRYLRHRRTLADQALARLTDSDPAEDQEVAEAEAGEEEQVEQKISLHEQRHSSVLAVLRASGAASILDLGCSTGSLLRRLIPQRQFTRIVGLDVSHRALEIAADRLHLDHLSESQRQRITLLHGSLIYRDQRLAGFDAAAVIEVIEHLDPHRLAAFERVLFEFAKPKVIMLTTPNVEYNVRFESLAAGKLRHRDHRFEWTRNQFREWASTVADRFGYTVRYLPVGPEDPQVGPPTQMGVFERV
jgi:3' terminal RNA ribose 2'-O-methyltransferase Hen1